MTEIIVWKKRQSVDIARDEHTSETSSNAVREDRVTYGMMS